MLWTCDWHTECVHYTRRKHSPEPKTQVDKKAQSANRDRCPFWWIGNNPQLWTCCDCSPRLSRFVSVLWPSPARMDECHPTHLPTPLLIQYLVDTGQAPGPEPRHPDHYITGLPVYDVASWPSRFYAHDTSLRWRAAAVPLWSNVLVWPSAPSPGL